MIGLRKLQHRGPLLEDICLCMPSAGSGLLVGAIQVAKSLVPVRGFWLLPSSPCDVGFRENCGVSLLCIVMGVPTPKS